MNNLHRQVKNILTRDQAQELLEDYIDELIKCVQVGLDTFMSFYPDELRKLSQPRTFANVLNDAVCHEAVRVFGDGHDKNVVVNDDYHGHLFVFFGRAAIRFKMVGPALDPRNVRTGRQNKIADQQLELDGVDRLTFLNLGYQPNVLFTEILAVSLSCRRRYLMWEIPLAHALTAYLFDQNGNVAPMGTPVVRPKLTGKVARRG